MILVQATREGLLNQKTATGYRVDTVVPFVALPSDAALRQWVLVVNPATKKRCKALVLDVGPWNTHDNAYVFQPATLMHASGLDLLPTMFTGVRPQAEEGTDLFGRHTNGAGIDFSEAVWAALGMTGNSHVCWEFM